MLQQLYIENIAVIEKSSMELTAGFNLLTGETGAGKSIIIDSINAVLGERTSRDLIRTGCDRAVVTAVFSLDQRLCAAIGEMGYPAEDGSLMISRTITSDGKNICKVGGRPATLSVLREIGKLLVNIHGQHDSQSLLDPATHYTFLDAMAGNGREKSRYDEAFNEYRTIAKQLRALDTDEAEKARTLELLNYQIEELSDADIQPGEMAKLKEKRQQLQNSGKILEGIAAVCGALKGNEDFSGAVSLLETAAEEGGAVGELMPELREDAERLGELVYELEAIADNWQRAQDNADFSPVLLDEIEDRLNLLYELGTKYGQTEEEMLEFLKRASEQRAGIEQSDRRRAELEDQLDAAQDKLITAAAALTKTRKAAGEKISADIGAELEFLNMPGVRFCVQTEPSKYDRTGADRVEFLISANPGEPPKPLVKIASGGELSRIMLAVKSVLAERDSIPTLIFDEIDTGISGRAARAVGIKLKQVSRGRQVICITHLAQIAAMADNHMLIEKQSDGQKTYTAVRTLSDEERVRELARIMSGGQLTESLAQTARELLEYGKSV